MAVVIKPKKVRITNLQLKHRELLFYLQFLQSYPLTLVYEVDLEKTMCVHVFVCMRTFETHK